MSGREMADYHKSCRRGAHLVIRHREGEWRCACPCHAYNEANAWWVEWATLLRSERKP